MSNDNGHDAEAAYFAKLDQENKQKLSAQLGARRLSLRGSISSRLLPPRSDFNSLENSWRKYI